MNGDAGPLHERVDELAGLIAGSSRILVFTGAGISTASGIPDYRGPRGVWKTRRPVYYAEFMESADERRRYWAQKLEDHAEFGAAAPNAGHHAVVEMERAGKVEMVVTQNVDGLHAAAGTSPRLLVEVHGTARLVECQWCGERSDPEPHFETFRTSGDAPDCHCGGPLKAATISFGQSLRGEEMQRALVAADNADLALAVGSTLSVHPAADIPLAAARAGASYAIVNRGRTEHDGHDLVTLRLDGDVTEILPEAVHRALG